jgi:uridylate kinase
MADSFKKKVVMSLGGSLIFPKDDLDLDFLLKFKELVKNFVSQGMQFCIITGGGGVARKYMYGARSVSELPKDEVDKIGITAVNLNAHLVRLLFYGDAYPSGMITPQDITEEALTFPIMVGGAEKPGMSTDYDTIIFAHKMGATEVINLSNIQYVYDKDPAKHTDALPVKELSWKDYISIIPSEWDSGLNTPFDPVASREAMKNDMVVHIIKGLDIENIGNLLSGRDFIGTTIHP